MRSIMSESRGLQLLQVFEILPQAVTGEPFSTADSLLSRENTGNFRDSGPYWLLRQNLKNLQKLQSVGAAASTMVRASTASDGIWSAIPVQGKYSSCMNPTPHPGAAQLASKSGISFVEEVMVPNTGSYCA